MYICELIYKWFTHEKKFFKYLEVYVKKFAEENGFSKIVFFAPFQK